MTAFLSPTPVHGTARARTRRVCQCRVVVATVAPQRVIPPQIPSPPEPTPPIVDGPYNRFMIWGLRALLRMQTGNTSPLPGYSGLVDECRLLLATAGAEEQRNLVERLLNAAVMPPIGVFLFRTFFRKNPKFNADLTPLAFTWLVGEAERNNPPEGGEGVLIKKCRFLEEARCKGLCINMCQQPVQNLFTDTLGLPLRMTPDYETNSCQMTFGVLPLPREQDPALQKGCLAECALGKKFASVHNGKECTVQPDTNATLNATNNVSVSSVLPKSAQETSETSSQK